MATDTVRIIFEGTDKGVENTVEGIEKSLDKLSTKGKLALAGITTAMDKMTVSFLKGGIEYDAQIETYLTRLTTLTGSAEKANDVLEQIKKDALKTPFDVSSLTQAESLLLATGLSAQDARKDILALGDAVSASGGGNAELQRMAVNLQQIKNVGKASALDIKQFAYAGIDIYGLLADSMGTTREEASKMDITYEMLSKALQKASSSGGKYYKAMEKQSETYAGATSNLKESLDVLKGEVAKDLFNAIKKIIPVLTQMFDWLGKNHKVVEALVVPLLVFFNTIMLWLGIQKIVGIISALNAVLLANPIMLVVAGILALIAVIVYLWNNCEGFRNFILGVFNAIKTAFEFLKNKVIFFINLIKLGIDGLKKTFQMIKDKAVEIKDGIVKKFQEIKDGIKEKVQEIIDKIGEKIQDFKDMGKKLIEGLWNGIKEKWDKLKGKVKNFGKGIVDGFKGALGIHSPSTLFRDEIGKYLSEGIVVGFTANMDKSSKQMLDSVNGAFGLSPTLTGTANTHFSPNVNVVVNNNMKTDPLGQVVNNVKTFSGGAKNDYNYGYGG